MKTKTVLTILVVYFYSGISFAQQLTEQEKGNNTRWSVSAGVNSIDFMPGYAGYLQYTSDGGDGSLQGSGERKNRSLSLSFTPRYYVNSELLLRFEFGFSNIFMTRFSEIKKSTHETYFSQVKQKSYRYIIGIEQNLFKKKRVEFFGGIIVPFVHYGNVIFSDSSFSRDSLSNSLISWWTGRSDIEGGMSVGLGPILRLNYKFLKHISISAESSYAFYYTKAGGLNNSSSLYYPTLTAQPIITTNISKDTFSGFHFSKIHSSFNLSIYF